MRQVTEGLVLPLSCRKNFWLQPSRGYNQPRLRQFSFFLRNICVASKRTTKERKSFDNVLFSPKFSYLCCQQWYNQGEGKGFDNVLVFVSFLYLLYLLHTLIFVHLSRNQNFGCKGKEKAKQSIRFSLIHVVNTKQNCILSQPFTLILTWSLLTPQILLEAETNTKFLSSTNTKEGEEGFWRNPAILWLRRAAGGRNMRQITQEKTGKLPKAWWSWSWYMTMMITKCVNYVLVIKFDLGCSESELLIDPLFFTISSKSTNTHYRKWVTFTTLTFAISKVTSQKEG